jgi:hypothetical protein
MRALGCSLAGSNTLSGRFCRGERVEFANGRLGQRELVIPRILADVLRTTLVEAYCCRVQEAEVCRTRVAGIHVLCLRHVAVVAGMVACSPTQLAVAD